MIKILSASYEAKGNSVDVTKIASMELARSQFIYIGKQFGDPFPMVHKSMRISYEYKGKVFEEILNEESLFIPRPYRVEGVDEGSQDFQIEWARYGANKWADVTELTRQKFSNPLEYFTLCNYIGEWPVLDPENGTKKYFVVKFSYRGKTYISSSYDPDSSCRLLKPLFSVIIPTWNRAPFLKRCIDSVISQDSFHDRIETIVVDDGSTDDTSKVMAEICAAYPDKIFYCRLPHTGCCGLVRNYGVKISSGDYLAYLDTDDKYEPNHLRVAFDRLQVIKGLAVRTWNTFALLRLKEDGSITETMEEDWHKKLRGRWAIYPSCYVHRRELFKHIGRHYPFPIRRAGEDVFFWWDVTATGERLGMKHDTDEVILDRTVMYGLIVDGNNLTYAWDDCAKEYRDRDKNISDKKED